MDRQIVNPDPGKNFNATISTGNPHFEMENKIYIAVVQIVSRLRIVMLDDTVLSLKNLVQFLIKYESQITQKCFDSPRSSVKSLLSVLARFPKWRHL